MEDNHWSDWRKGGCWMGSEADHSGNRPLSAQERRGDAAMGVSKVNAGSVYNLAVHVRRLAEEFNCCCKALVD
jgi:hypothetical protein